MFRSDWPLRIHLLEHYEERGRHQTAPDRSLTAPHATRLGHITRLLRVVAASTRSGRLQSRRLDLTGPASATTITSFEEFLTPAFTPLSA